MSAYDWQDRLVLIMGGMRALIDLYDAGIRSDDRHLGALLDLLEARGLLSDTLVVVVGDHGEAFGEGGRWEQHVHASEEILHIPMILRLPGAAHAGQRVGVPASPPSAWIRPPSAGGPSRSARCAWSATRAASASRTWSPIRWDPRICPDRGPRCASGWPVCWTPSPKRASSLGVKPRRATGWPARSCDAWATSNRSLTAPIATVTIEGVSIIDGFDSYEGGAVAPVPRPPTAPHLRLAS